MKPVSEEAITRLFYSLTGRPVPSDGLTEAQWDAREKEWLQARCLWEIRAARREELEDELAKCLGLPVTIELPEADLDRLHRVLAG